MILDRAAKRNSSVVLLTAVVMLLVCTNSVTAKDFKCTDGSNVPPGSEEIKVIIDAYSDKVHITNCDFSQKVFILDMRLPTASSSRTDDMVVILDSSFKALRFVFTNDAHMALLGFTVKGSPDKPKHLIEEIKVSGGELKNVRMALLFERIKFKSMDSAAILEGSSSIVLKDVEEVDDGDAGAGGDTTFSFRFSPNTIISVESSTFVDPVAFPPYNGNAGTNIYVTFKDVTAPSLDFQTDMRYGVVLIENCVLDRGGNKQALRFYRRYFRTKIIVRNTKLLSADDAVAFGGPPAKKEHSTTLVVRSLVLFEGCTIVGSTRAVTSKVQHPTAGSWVSQFSKSIVVFNASTITGGVHLLFEHNDAIKGIEASDVQTVDSLVAFWSNEFKEAPSGPSVIDIEASAVTLKVDLLGMDKVSGLKLSNLAFRPPISDLEEQLAKTTDNLIPSAQTIVVPDGSDTSDPAREDQIMLTENAAIGSITLIQCTIPKNVTLVGPFRRLIRPFVVEDVVGGTNMTIKHIAVTSKFHLSYRSGAPPTSVHLANIEGRAADALVDDIRLAPGGSLIINNVTTRRIQLKVQAYSHNVLALTNVHSKTSSAIKDNFIDIRVSDNSQASLNTVTTTPGSLQYAIFVATFNSTITLVRPEITAPHILASIRYGSSMQFAQFHFDMPLNISGKGVEDGSAMSFVDGAITVAEGASHGLQFDNFPFKNESSLCFTNVNITGAPQSTGPLLFFAPHTTNPKDAAQSTRIVSSRIQFSNCHFIASAANASCIHSTESTTAEATFLTEGSAVAFNDCSLRGTVNFAAYAPQRRDVLPVLFIAEGGGGNDFHEATLIFHATHVASIAPYPLVRLGPGGLQWYSVVLHRVNLTYPLILARSPMIPSYGDIMVIDRSIIPAAIEMVGVELGKVSLFVGSFPMMAVKVIEVQAESMLINLNKNELSSFSLFDVTTVGLTQVGNIYNLMVQSIRFSGPSSTMIIRNVNTNSKQLRLNNIFVSSGATAHISDLNSEIMMKFSELFVEGGSTMVFEKVLGSNLQFNVLAVFNQSRLFVNNFTAKSNQRLLFSRLHAADVSTVQVTNIDMAGVRFEYSVLSDSSTFHLDGLESSLDGLTMVGTIVMNNSTVRMSNVHAPSASYTGLEMAGSATQHGKGVQFLDSFLLVSNCVLGNIKMSYPSLKTLYSLTRNATFSFVDSQIKNDVLLSLDREELGAAVTSSTTAVSFAASCDISIASITIHGNAESTKVWLPPADQWRTVDLQGVVLMTPINHTSSTSALESITLNFVAALGIIRVENALQLKYMQVSKPLLHYPATAEQQPEDQHGLVIKNSPSHAVVIVTGTASWHPTIFILEDLLVANIYLTSLILENTTARIQNVTTVNELTQFKLIITCKNTTFQLVEFKHRPSFVAVSGLATSELFITLEEGSAMYFVDSIVNSDVTFNIHSVAEGRRVSMVMDRVRFHTYFNVNAGVALMAPKSTMHVTNSHLSSVRLTLKLSDESGFLLQHTRAKALFLERLSYFRGDESKAAAAFCMNNASLINAEIPFELNKLETTGTQAPTKGIIHIAKTTIEGNYVMQKYAHTDADKVIDQVWQDNIIKPRSNFEWSAMGGRCASRRNDIAGKVYPTGLVDVYGGNAADASTLYCQRDMGADEDKWNPPPACVVNEKSVTLPTNQGEALPDTTVVVEPFPGQHLHIRQLTGVLQPLVRLPTSSSWSKYARHWRQDHTIIMNNSNVLFPEGEEGGVLGQCKSIGFQIDPSPPPTPTMTQSPTISTANKRKSRTATRQWTPTGELSRTNTVGTTSPTTEATATLVAGMESDAPETSPPPSTDAPVEVSETLGMVQEEPPAPPSTPRTVSVTIMNDILGSEAASTSVAATGTVSTTISGAMNPSSMGQVVRTGFVLSSINCQYSDDDMEPSYMEYPLQFAFFASSSNDGEGGNKEEEGTAVRLFGDAALSIFACLLAPINVLFWGFHLATRHGVLDHTATVALRGQKIFSIAAGLTISYLTPSIIKAAVLSIFHDGPSAVRGVLIPITLVAVGFIVAIALFVLLWLRRFVVVASRSSKSSLSSSLLSEEEDERSSDEEESSSSSGQTTKSTTSTSSQGEELTDKVPKKAFLATFHIFFDATEDPWKFLWRGYYFEDVLASCLLAAIDGIRPTGASCGPIAIAMLIVCILHLLYHVLVRPLQERVETAFAIAIAAIQCLLASICCVVSHGDAEDYPEGSTPMKVLGVGTLLVNIIFFAQVAALAMMEYTRSQKKRARELAKQRGDDLLGSLINPTGEDNVDDDSSSSSSDEDEMDDTQRSRRKNKQFDTASVEMSAVTQNPIAAADQGRERTANPQTNSNSSGVLAVPLLGEEK